MQQICRNPWCAQSFEITDEDLAFYDKVSPVFPSTALGASGGKKYLIPPPTLCPDCRRQRRTAFRNERNLYRRTCDRTKKAIISMYAPDAPYTVYDHREWWGDGWDGRQYAVEYLEDVPFLLQHAELARRVPRRSVAFFQNENSDYTNMCSHCKDCYLLFSSDYCERCCYVSYLEHCTGVFDSTMGTHNDRCHDCFHCFQCTTCRTCIDARQCSDSQYLYDCTDCDCCTLCTGLRNKRHCLRNIQYSPAQYTALVAQLQLHSVAGIRAAEEEFSQRMIATPRPPLHLRSSEKCSGDYLTGCHHCTATFVASGCRDCRYFGNGIDCSDCMDCDEVGYSELCYEAFEGFPRSYHVLFSYHTSESSDLLYCDSCYHCQQCFGCAGLRNARFCILNRQYTEEEYGQLVPKIIDQMRTDGSWGEFFPMTSATFAYNQSSAMDTFPINPAEAQARGWRWREVTDDVPNVEKIIPAAKLPGHIGDIPDDILNWAVECEVTGRPFKIIRQELQFYRSMNIPVPTLHPDERHRRRMTRRNPRKLWQKSCATCSKAMETSYAPNRPEKVVCEDCYHKEIY